MTQTSSIPTQDDPLVADLRAIQIGGAKRSVVAECVKLVEIAALHIETARPSDIRVWLRQVAETVPTPTRDEARGGSYPNAIRCLLGLDQGTDGLPRARRERKAADALAMTLNSIRQPKSGVTKIDKLINALAEAIRNHDDAIKDDADIQLPASQSSAVAFYSTAQVAYDAALAEIEAVLGDPDVTIDMTSLRSSFDTRSGRSGAKRPIYSERLHQALLDHAATGGHVRRIVNITHTDVLTLERERQETLRGRCDAPSYELRAFVLDALPGFAPVIIHGRAAFLGQSDPAAIGITGGCGFWASDGIAMCTRAFEALWNDTRAKWLTTNSLGISPEAVTEIEQDIQELARRRAADRPK
jgi:hypothetical protein